MILVALLDTVKWLWGRGENGKVIWETTMDTEDLGEILLSVYSIRAATSNPHNFFRPSLNNVKLASVCVIQRG